jgi:hypothetical protein
MDWHLTVRLVVIGIAVAYVAGPLLGEWRGRSL